MFGIAKKSPAAPERALRFAEVVDLQKKRTQRIRLAVLILAIVVFFLGLHFLKSFFVVRKIVCVQESLACDSVLLSSTQSLLSRSMFSRLTLSNTFLDVKVTKIWPNALNVKFQKPALLLTLVPSQPTVAPYSITKSGVIVSFTGDFSVLPPIIDLELESKKVGDHVSLDMLLFYQNLISSLSMLQMKEISLITVTSPEEVGLKLDKNSLALADQANISSELKALQTILISSTLERQGKTIDLRFENPVLK